jgi:hypothetical protein
MRVNLLQGMGPREINSSNEKSTTDEKWLLLCKKISQSGQPTDYGW